MGMDRETTEDLTMAEGDGPEPAAAAQQPAGRGMTRRRALKYALAGVAGAGGVGVLAHVVWRVAERLRRTGWSGAPSAEVFENDAPTGRVWELWRKRGWAIEARHYRSLGRSVRCQLCPNDCLLGPDDRGRCRNRVNKDGTLYTLVYGNPCSFHIDPIEKKPLFHFLPGTGVFSVATSGCGFRCLNCQNWDISQRKPEETKDPRGEELRCTPQRLPRLRRADVARLTMFPEDVVDIAETYHCPSVAYTYSEPTAFYEYMVDSSKLAHARNIRNVWVTCGYIQQKPLEELCDVMDGANVDLKSFRPETYRKLNSGKLQPILDTLKTLKARGVWFEVTNLVVPTYTDDMTMIRQMCRWLLDNLGPDHPLHFSRFYPHHRLTHLPPTPRDVLVEARQIAMAEGLHYVYVGNIRGIEGGETTFCPGCKRPIIERYGYLLKSVNVKDGRCTFCRARIAGVWKA